MKPDQAFCANSQASHPYLKSKPDYELLLIKQQIINNMLLLDILLKLLGNGTHKP